MMSEKRFTITKEFKAIHDEDGTTITYCDYLSDAEQLVDLLNQLSKENEMLKKDLECLRKASSLLWEKYCLIEFKKDEKEHDLYGDVCKPKDFDNFLNYIDKSLNESKELQRRLDERNG